MNCPSPIEAAAKEASRQRREEARQARGPRSGVERPIAVYAYLKDGAPGTWPEVCYVGQSYNVNLRHAKHLRGETPFGKTLGAELKKFTLLIVDQCIDVPSGEKINALENAWMDRFSTFAPLSGRGYNFTRAGGSWTEGGIRARGAAISASLYGRKRKPFSVSHRAAIGKVWRGRKRKPRSPSHREALSTGLRGRRRKPLSPSHKAALSSALLGNNNGAGLKHSGETLRKVSTSLHAAWTRPEMRAKQGSVQRAAWARRKAAKQGGAGQ